MQSKIDDLNDYTFELGANLEVDRKKVKTATVKYERAAKCSKNNIEKEKSLKEWEKELKDELASIAKLADEQKELLKKYESQMPPHQVRK